MMSFREIYEKQFVFNWLKKGSLALETLLYPPKCLKCKTYMDAETVMPYALESCFCDPCLSAGFHRIAQPYCVKCGIQLPAGHLENHVCGNCLKTPLKLEKIRAVSEYSGIIKEAVPLFKYQSKLSLAKVFERLLFQTFLDHFHEKTPVDLIMPIPLHLTKLRQRGFNQAYLMARNFKQLYLRHFGIAPGWDIDIHSMIRKKKTKSQTGFDMDQRKTNLKHAFSITDREKINNQSVLLVDDVLTTGATCNEAAALLLESGAANVHALVLARA